MARISQNAYNGGFGKKKEEEQKPVANTQNTAKPQESAKTAQNGTYGAEPAVTAAAPQTVAAPTVTQTQSEGTQQASPAASPAPEQKEYTPYTPSQTVVQAQTMLNEQMAQRPGAYASDWADQLNDAVAKILNREPFSYDLNADALYQQYKDQYMNLGRLAMMDTMGQAQASTGGYGSSYAQSVGQQAYNAYLQQLNEIVPELYGQAFDRYQAENEMLMQDAALLGDMEDQEYTRYLDQLNAWQAERDYLAGRADAERDYDYSLYADDRNFGYQQYRDQMADWQWKTEYDEDKRRYDQEYAQSLQRASGSGVGTVSDDGEEAVTPGDENVQTFDDGSRSTDEIKRAQAFLGVEQTGVWDSMSNAAATANGYGGLHEVVSAMNGSINSGDKLTYEDVALTAAQLRKNGASKNDIYQYLSSAIKGSNYIPTNSILRDLEELRSAYASSGR